MYYLKRKIKKGKVENIGEIKGLITKPNNKGIIKVKELIIVDKNISNSYIKKQLDKKFKKMYKKIYDYLEESEGSEDGIKSCLSEIEKLKSYIFYKYQEYMKVELYREYLAKIVLTEQELKKKDKEREIFNQMIKNAYMNYYEPEEIERGRGR